VRCSAGQAHSRILPNDAAGATPLIFSRVAVVCRRWCTLLTLSPCASQMRRKDRTRLRGSIGRPVLVGNTSPLSCQARPSSARSDSCASRRITSTSFANFSRGRSRRAAAVLTRPIHRRPFTRCTLPDTYLIVSLVDVVPPHAKDLTAPQPVQQQEQEGRVERIILGSVEECAGLLSGHAQRCRRCARAAAAPAVSPRRPGRQGHARRREAAGAAAVPPLPRGAGWLFAELGT
jgi:hypothetical protein